MTPLFADYSPFASRQPKTDRLILDKYLTEASNDQRLDEEEIDRAHRILVRWADLEKSGKLATKNETQLQGNFLREVFGDALGYTRFVEGLDEYHLIQHESSGTDITDAMLGRFRHEHDNTASLGQATYQRSPVLA